MFVQQFGDNFDFPQDQAQSIEFRSTDCVLFKLALDNFFDFDRISLYLLRIQNIIMRLRSAQLKIAHMRV